MFKGINIVETKKYISKNDPDQDKPLPMILGTNKIPAVFGTTTATYNYFKKVKPDKRGQ